MFTWKRNVALHLAQTRLPKSVYEYIDLGSEIFDLLPPSYRTIEATIAATPEKKKDPGARVMFLITRSSRPLFRLLGLVYGLSAR
jgi:hypothetical protein